MTVEQAMQRLKEHKINFSHDHGWDEPTIQALDIAIKSLDMWDKVAKEIYERHERYSICRESECIGNVLWSDELIKVSDCLDIIEKYKKEIEE